MQPRLKPLMQDKVTTRWWEVGFSQGRGRYYHFHCQSSKTETDPQPGNCNNLETGIKLAEWEFSSLSGLCGLRSGGKFKGSLFHWKLGWRPGKVAVALKEWLGWVVQALSIRLQST